MEGFIEVLRLKIISIKSLKTAKALETIHELTLSAEDGTTYNAWRTLEVIRAVAKEGLK